jgi:uracil-DNA glycosylase family 4
MKFPYCTAFEALNPLIVQCTLCPRLVQFRENVLARTSFKNQHYWRSPVPGFGDPNAWLLIIGLAPAAHGGNRTGRIFTGDESGRFLFQNLYKEGFANQPNSEFIGDGLQLFSCYITAAVKCAPPNNRPTPEEFVNCHRYLINEFFLLSKVTAVLALGHTAFDAYLFFLHKQGIPIKGIKFEFGRKISFEGWPTLYCSYHPSPQNTYTGKLSAAQFCQLLHQIKLERKET